jgi:putative oxidoreductase
MNQILSNGLLRVLFAIPFAVFGVMHLMNAAAMQGMVPAYVPGGVIWVYITGVLLITGAIGFILNKSVQMAGYVLGALMLVFILTIHLPAVLGGDQNSMGSLLKDFALLAGALFIGGSSSK